MDLKARVNFPPDPNPRKPKWRLPEKSCDTHFHVFGPPHVYPFAEERRYTPPAAPLAHYLAIAEFLGVERGVLVHPTVHGDDLRVTLDALARSDGRFRGMMRASRAFDAARYRELHRDGVRGVRFNLVEELGGVFDAALFQAIARHAADLGWCVCVHADGATIETMADELRTCPAPVVIDHFGRVDARLGVGQPAFRAILDLMGEPHMWIKISGLDRMMARGATYADVPPFAQALIARAPDRVVWGTDWPHSMVFEPGRMPNDGDLVDALLDLVPDEAARTKVLVDNPARLFGF